MTKTAGLACILGTLLLACGAAPEGTTLTQDEPAAEVLERLDPRLQDAAEQAIQLWNDAAGESIPLPSRIELADLGADTEHAGGWVPSRDTIVISALVSPEKMVSTIGHELGHYLGLEHEVGTGALMDPDRPSAARLHPCVSADAVAAAGFAGTGACLE